MINVLLAALLSFPLISFSQYSDFGESSTSIQLYTGYTHDFPGLNGYTISAECIHSMTSFIKAGIAVKRISAQGYPRVHTVQEFTHATTLDLNAYVVPLQDERQELNLGLGYSFSFYQIKRSFPLTQQSGIDKTTVWPETYEKGRVSGFSLMASYEYKIPASAFSVGVRAALFKAYDGVSSIGPFVGIRL